MTNHDYYVALAAEIHGDPAGMGYAGKTPDQVLALVNGPSKSDTKQQPLVPMAHVLKWGAKSGVRSHIEDACLNTSSPVRGIALAVRDMLQGPAASVLDVSDPDIVGTGGLLDALVSAGVMAAADKASVIALQNVPASRGEALFGAGWVVSADDIMRAN